MPNWKPQLIEELDATRKSLLKEGMHSATDLDELKKRLIAAGSIPSEKAWESFSSGIAKLQSALKSNALTQPEIEEFESCSKRIADAASGRITPETRTGSDIADVVLGCFGIYLSALLSEDYRAAVIVLYKSTELYPAAAVQVFPKSAFTSDFREILRRSHHELVRTVRTHSGLEQANTVKKVKRLPTQIFKTFIAIPGIYVVALFESLFGVSEDRYPGVRRRTGYWAKVNAIMGERIGRFDTIALEKGWLIGRNQIQKEEMLADQVRRIKSIFHNHCLATVQEAKARRREIESQANLV